MPLPPLFDAPDGYDPEAVAAASAAVRVYCGWHVAPVITETLTLDGSGGYRQLLPSLHVDAVADVTELGLLLDDLSWDWSAVGYLTKAWGWTTWSEPWSPVWTTKLRGVDVTLTHGYDTVPVEVRAVVLGLARAGLAPLRATAETAGPFSVSLTEQGQAGPFGIGVYEAAILDRYRIPGRL